MEFLKGYSKWEDLSDKEKVEVVRECVKFYENKTLDYILSNLPVDKRKKFKKTPVKIEFISEGTRRVSFGDNVVFIKSLTGKKSSLFFKIAQNTICAVFANIFKNTTGNKGKKTKFGQLASGFLASITSEFAKGAELEGDMMSEFGMTLDMGLVLD